MSLKDWCMCIGVGALTLAIVILCGYGALELLVDTGHRILH